MSEKYRPAFADPHRGIVEPTPTIGQLWAYGPGTPSGLSLPAGGYAVGCLFQDITNGDLYKNVGTTTTASWVKLQIAALSGAMTNTAISTAGAGTLTAAGIVGGVITRTGPTAIYTDTTDTAALIVAALPAGTPVGTTWLLFIKNTVAFNETLAGGTGVTITGSTIIPPNSMGTFVVTYTSASAIAILGLNVDQLTVSPLMVSTSLTTNGAGTITAAGIAGGLTNRTGSTAAFTDTTDTAANIIAALPNANIGQSFVWTYYNNTLGTATITGGAGVTVTAGLVPFNCWAEFLVTYTAAATVTITAMAMGPTVALPAAQYVTQAYQSATVAAGDLTGANVCHFNNTGTTPANVQTRSASQMFGDIPNCQIGFTYTLFVRNSSGSANTLTLTAGSNVTLTGTMTVAQNVTRMFEVVFPSATTCTIQSMGLFAAGA